MTKKWHLELRDGVYCEKGRRESRGALMEWWKPLVCLDFATGCLAPRVPGSEIDVTITDTKPIKDGIVVWAEVTVQRQGYYRWWVSLGASYKITSHGVYHGVEDILMGMFPNEWDKRENGKDPIFLSDEGKVEEHTLWIRIV